MVVVPSAVLADGLAASKPACAEALAEGMHSAGIILNILATHAAIYNTFNVKRHLIHRSTLRTMDFGIVG